MSKYDYDNKYPFAIAVSNLGLYNEGELNFEWLELPAKQVEINLALKKIGIGELDDYGNEYEEWFISDYDDYSKIGIAWNYGEYSSIDTLNSLAYKLEEMNELEYEKLVQTINEMRDSNGEFKDFVDMNKLIDNLKDKDKDISR